MNEQAISFGALAFGLAMLVPVAPLVWWYNGRLVRNADHEVRSRIFFAVRKQTRYLWTAWSVSIAIITAWWLFERYSGSTLSQIVPFNIAVLLAFHLLWWPFAAPVMNRFHRLAEEADLVASPNLTSIRTASLKSRLVSDYLPSNWKWVVGMVVATGTMCVLMPLISAGDIELRFRLMALGFMFIGILEIVIWRWAITMEVTTSGNYGGLKEEAAESLRQFRIRGFFWLLMTTSVLFFAAGLGCVMVGTGALSEPSVGVLGGVAGGAIGLMGAVFGIAAGFKAQRLHADSAQTDPPTH